MFNLFFRRYLPGFRLGPDGAPRFNIDDNSLPQRESASSDGTLPNSAAQRYPDAAQTQIPPSISFRLPGAKGWVLSAPPIGSPGFRVSPQDDVPGFNVRPQVDSPGFNVDENGGQQPETTWSDGLPPGSVTAQDPSTTPTPTPPPDVGDSAPPAPPPLPDWPYQFGTMLPPRLPIAFDPRTGPRIEINPSPGSGSAAASGVYPWLPPSTPLQPTNVDIRSRAPTTQTTNSQPATRQAIRNSWLQRPTDVWPYAPADGALRAIAPIRPLADSNFSLTNAGDAGGRKAQQQMLLQQYQETQPTMPSAPLGTGPAMVHLPEKPGMTDFERGPGQELPQFVEAYQRLKESEGRRAISDQRSLQPLNPVQNTSRDNNLGLIGSAQGQTPVQKPRPAQIDRALRDDGGLPNGGVVSSVGPPRTPRGNDEIIAGGISPRDLNIHLVGDGDTPSDASDLRRRRERHKAGVRASIATALQRGFEIAIEEEVAVDVPGFPSPRFYDYIMKDPITGKYFGVEVKTTLYDTIRLVPSQVKKDAVVVAQGAKVRNRDVWLDGVSYSTYCFECEELDIRSWVLQLILRNAGVKMARGTLPGKIRP
jgi:hypothetical protein